MFSFLLEYISPYSVSTVAGMENGVDSEVGTDSKSRLDRSGAVAGAEVGVGIMIATAGGDAGADMQSTVAGVQVGPIVEMIPSACAAVNVRCGCCHRAGSKRPWSRDHCG